ncbi:unnamed protein product [Rhizophagus irregularis]|nr:unnamed protein product [Rhizophagus irregularis]
MMFILNNYKGKDIPINNKLCYNPKVLPTGDELLGVKSDSPLNNLRDFSFRDFAPGSMDFKPYPCFAPGSMGLKPYPCFTLGDINDLASH